MQILRISVYGENGERRDVKFSTGKVNIITGASKKGKSSLIDIVEYCLGSGECNVAEGCIRQTVKWYSVTLKFSDGEVFIARAAPFRGFKSNSSCHLLIASEIDLPTYDQLEASTNIDSVVNFLTSKIGIPEQVTEVPEDQTRSTIQVGFKHSRFYLFQGQDEVAAKRTLFHRQAEPHIPQAIKDTLPYFMGAAEDNRLSELERLRAMKRDRAKLLKRIKEIESIKGDGLQKGFGLLAEAANVGLYNDRLVLPDEALLISLRRIAQWTSANEEVEEPQSDPSYDLDKQLRRLSEEKRIVRSKLNTAKEYAGSASGFENVVGEQGLRLQSIGLYKKLESSDKCPVCNARHESSSDLERIIFSSLVELNKKLEGVSRNKPRISAYLSSLKEQDANLAVEIKKTRDAMLSLRKEGVEVLTKAALDEKRSHVVGRISLYLESIDWNEDTDSLYKKLKNLEPQIDRLEEVLDPSALKERLESQLSCVAEDMTAWARELGLEHSEHPIRLDVGKLTVVAETPYGRTPLYRMGSGENWVGYHLVTYMALAKWFIEQSRPVGNFVFFDQPTQVYFPSDSAVTGGLDEIPDDEDRKAVKKMFEWIFKIVEQLSPDLQVIITDHADIDEAWFQEAIADVKWRGDNALIPPHWYEK
ncbi:DUF3732 domain-containing protein [Halomonas pacifica]|uniref:DUF3732 domain-containing protein n=1 Tax=Bisbaumannia pacifica TaxID=77098 RepID=UPI002358E10C|nr:DUF3732 domain-containing protein [Halomonas pacifica]MDC8802225.1 DUF3732 domain-containing protein [Halomonas pacifica]